MLLAMTSCLHAQAVDPTCLVLWQKVYYPNVPDSLIDNYDSAMVDTCNDSIAIHEGLPEIYLQHYWEFVFQYDILPLDSVNADSTLIVGWDAIDTNYRATRDSFQRMAAKYGSVRLRKAFPNVIDSTIQSSNAFALILGSYYPADSVLNDLLNVPLVSYAWYDHPAPVEMVNQTQTLDAIKIIYIDPLHIRLSGIEESCPYVIFDIIGREISEGKIEGLGIIDLTILKAGCYFVFLNNHILHFFREP